MSANYPHELKLAIQCRDRNSGTVGSFLYLPAAPFFAASPVFADCVGVFAYMEERGLELVCGAIVGVKRTA